MADRLLCDYAMNVRRVLQRWSERCSAIPTKWLAGVALIWVCAAAAGLWTLWRYDNTPGESARAPREWPVATTLARATDRPTIILTAHPHCTCTRTSLGELAEAIARSQVHPKIYVLFMTPGTFADGWEKTDLWQSAAALPGATVVRDIDGAESRHFGAVTSGQTIVYDERGELAFSGGVTGARAHPGDNAGRQSVVAVLNREPVERRGTSVFGCPLFN